MKEKEILQLNYKQLCEYFNEEPKKSNARSRQFEKWRKTYSIEKMEGKNFYLVRQLNKGELSQTQLYFNYKQILEPMIYDVLSQEKMSEATHSLIISPLDFMIKLGLANDYYKVVKFNEDAKHIIFDDTNISTNEINNFQREVDKLNKRTIKDVLDSMVKKDLLIYNNKFVKKFYSNDGSIIENIMSNEEIAELITVRRNISKELYNKEYELLEDNLKRNNVNNKIKETLGFINYYSVYELILNNNGIVEDIQKNNYTYANKKQIINTKNQIRINKSSQGDLKLINQMAKEIITERLIDEKYIRKGEC